MGMHTVRGIGSERGRGGREEEEDANERNHLEFDFGGCVCM